MADNDRVVGTAGGNSLSAGNGNEIVLGHGGDDSLSGNDGADTIFGDSIVARNADIIGHAHLSEPDLALAPGNAEMAAKVISVLQDAGYAGWLSIEMRASGPKSCESLLLALGRLKSARALN